MSSKSPKSPTPVVPQQEAETSQGNGVSWQSNQEAMKQLFEYQQSNPVQAARASGMWQELSYPLLQDMPGSQKGGMDKYSLSFQDKSGFKDPTSHAYLNKAGAGKNWKGLRLDHGPNVKSGGQTNWHWNQKGSMNAFGKADHTLANPAAARTGSILKTMKPLSRGAMVVGAGMDAYDLGSEAHESMQTGEWDNTIEKGSEIAGGWAGAYAGAKGGGMLGASIGTAVGGPLGTVVGGALGGIAGGIGGYLAGSSLGKWASGLW